MRSGGRSTQPSRLRRVPRLTVVTMSAASIALRSRLGRVFQMSAPWVWSQYGDPIRRATAQAMGAM